MKKIIFALSFILILVFCSTVLTADEVLISDNLLIEELLSDLKIQTVKFPFVLEPDQSPMIYIDIYKNNEPSSESIRNLDKKHIEPEESFTIGTIIAEETNIFDFRITWAMNSVLNAKPNELKIVNSIPFEIDLPAIDLSPYIEANFVTTNFKVAEKITVETNKKIPLAIMFGFNREESVIGNPFNYNVNKLAQKHRLLVVISFIIYE